MIANWACGTYDMACEPLPKNVSDSWRRETERLKKEFNTLQVKFRPFFTGKDH